MSDRTNIDRKAAEPAYIQLVNILKEDIEKLRLYCRYPQILDERLWQQINEKYDYNNKTVDMNKGGEKIQD